MQGETQGFYISDQPLSMLEAEPTRFQPIPASAVCLESVFTWAEEKAGGLPNPPGGNSRL